MCYKDLPVTLGHLKILKNIAEKECNSFFERNPHLVKYYKDRLIAIALCQGAALQYLGKGYGVKDFDIHFFYLQNPLKLRLSRTVFRIESNIVDFGEIPIDFIRTVVPYNIANTIDNPVSIIKRFLEVCPTSNAYNLSKKAVVGLFPSNILGKIIWPGYN